MMLYLQIRSSRLFYGYCAVISFVIFGNLSFGDLLGVTGMTGRLDGEGRLDLDPRLLALELLKEAILKLQKNTSHG